MDDTSKQIRKNSDLVLRKTAFAELVISSMFAVVGVKALTQSRYGPALGAIAGIGITALVTETITSSELDARAYSERRT